MYGPCFFDRFQNLCYVSVYAVGSGHCAFFDWRGRLFRCTRHNRRSEACGFPNERFRFLFAGRRPCL